jgi:hypothetical protein
VKRLIHHLAQSSYHHLKLLRRRRRRRRRMKMKRVNLYVESLSAVTLVAS